MCGFVATIHLDGTPVHPSLLKTMTDAQRHRGPDDQGFCLFSLKGKEFREFNPGESKQGSDRFDAGFGFNRLSIIDLSDAGHQPMGNRDKSIFIVFNGEIYNSSDFRAELEKSGFVFKGQSDTEVILYLYEKYGFTEMLARINGMFSIIIADLNKNVLYIARDRLGIKPLYYFKNSKCLLFSSEIKSFLHHPDFKPEIKANNLDEFLTFRYTAGEETLFNDVKQVRPGYSLTFDGKNLREEQYWSPPSINPRLELSPADSTSIIEEGLRESVQQRLVSDVDLGCQLSGGIDSSLINLFAKKTGGNRMQSFSVIFEDPLFSEEKWIDEAAAVSCVDTNKYTLEEDYFAQNYKQATWHLDLPINHPNSIGLFFLAQNARKKVTVMLSGEGADEIFGGYSRFFYANFKSRYSNYLPLANLVPKIKSKLTSGFGHHLDTDPVMSFILSSAFADDKAIRAIYPDFDLDRATASRKRIFEEETGSYLSKCLNYDTKTYLPELLIRQDKMTMAHSMENRVPFLDHRFIEKIKSIPPAHLVGSKLHLNKIIQKNTKISLKHLAQKFFPDSFVYRKKSGFGIPANIMLNSPMMRENIHDGILPGIKSRGIFDFKAIESLWAKLSTLTPAETNILWLAFSFEVWADLFIDKKTNG